MNSTQHIFIGAAGTYLIYILLATLFRDSVLIVVALFVSMFGSVLPDNLEPAVHYTHRKKYHSWGTLKYVAAISALLLSLTLVSLIMLFESTLIFCVFAFFFSYMLHLLADSTTPMGLPRA